MDKESETKLHDEWLEEFHYKNNEQSIPDIRIARLYGFCILALFFIWILVLALIPHI